VSPLVGRTNECTRLDEMMESARSGRSRVVVLRGEPGLGKTVLLDYAQASAADLLVLRLAGAQSEMELSFSGLHQILLPFLNRLGTLPSLHQDSLRRAFGLQAGGPPDRFLVGLAALGLLADGAVAKPLLCLVDDAQWLDRESAHVLAFVARRLDADAITVIFAVREPTVGEQVLAGLPDIVLTGLDAEHAEQLLRSVAPDDLSEAVVSTIVSEATGNPLALIEIGRGLEAEQRSGTVELPRPLPIGRRLEGRFLDEVKRLGMDSQRFLLAAAADPTGDLGLLARAGQQLDFDMGSAAAAERRKLVSIGSTIHFRHPLVRSAVYYGASMAERTATHAALAQATDAERDPDRYAWHLAHASVPPHRAVAELLAAAGDRAAGRSRWAAAGSLYARAAPFACDLRDFAHLMLKAAEVECVDGSLGRAQAHLDEAEPYRDELLHRVRVQVTQGRIHGARREPSRATLSLLAAAEEMAGVDIRAARAILCEAFLQSRQAERFATEGATQVDVARACRACALPPSAVPTTGDRLLDALATLHLDGVARAAPLIIDSIEAMRSETGQAPETLAWLEAACMATGPIADEQGHTELARRLEQQSRRQGTVIWLASSLYHQGVGNIIAGLLHEARIAFGEVAAIDEARGAPNQLGELLMAAFQGETDRTMGLAAEMARSAAESGQGFFLAYAEYGICLVELARGRYPQALASVVGRVNEASVMQFALIDLIEAAHRSGDLIQARSLTAQLANVAALAPLPLSLGSLARARAMLLDDDPAAEEHYREAISQHSRTRGPSYVARSHLVYGEWLRRQRRLLPAREHLHSALSLFETIGARGFADRARNELLAAGGKSQSRSPGPNRHLTARELQVARLALTGATNPQIASQMFISASTVDYHLRKVFRKAGVTSRHQLSGVLSATDKGLAESA
jgi:DNA-binding CsgD family transcriptional regulator